GLPGEADRIAQAGGEDAAGARLEVEHVNRGAALLGGHALVGDVGERAYAGEELAAVGAGEKAAGPVAAWLEVDELAARRGDAGLAVGVGEGDDAVGVADVEGVAEKRHAE